jgi:hypothetical protein
MIPQVRNLSVDGVGDIIFHGGAESDPTEPKSTRTVSVCATRRKVLSRRILIAMAFNINHKGKKISRINEGRLFCFTLANPLLPVVALMPDLINFEMKASLHTSVLPVLIVLILACVSSSASLAQNSSDNKEKPILMRPNAVYFELAGNAFFYSLNYERSFYCSERITPFLRGGLFMVRFTLTPKKDAILVSEAGIRIGSPKHALDLGLGYSNVVGYPDDYLLCRLGYRFQGKRGLFLRLAPLVYIKRINTDGVFNGAWWGASLGYAF